MILQLSPNTRPDGTSACCVVGATRLYSRAARLLTVVVALLAVFAFAAQVAWAGAIGDGEELARFGGVGQGAGQLSLPRGVAADPVTGHVYVSEIGNNRIGEFTPWGEFVKAFGWDVAPAAVNEQQEVRVSAAAGKFALRFEGELTQEIPFDASAGEVRTALEGLGAVGPGEVGVRQVASALDGRVPIVYVVAFKGGSLGGRDVPQLQGEQGTPSLSGGVSSTSLVVRTRVDGHAATTGFESCSEESGCRAGLRGPGAGEFHEPTGVAVDGVGDVYVMETGNHRVQEFDSAGRFVLMFGGEVDKTTHANLCTAESHDVCGAGVTGTGNGQFQAEGGGGIALCPGGSALCPGGALFVNDHDRIQRFSLGGEYESQLAVGSGNLQQLAFDPLSKDLYATFGEKEGVHKLDSSTGVEIPPILKVNGGGPVATDPVGDVFAASGSEHLVLEFDPAGKALSPSSCCEGEELSSPPFKNGDHFEIQGLGTNTVGTLYVTYFDPIADSFIRSFGPGPTVFEAPSRVPPTIGAQFASSVQTDGATVAADINPHFWSDARYFVQFGTGKCSEGGCVQEAPVAPGALLTSRLFGRPVLTAGVALEGLSPGTAYHYRFVAQSGGGGPVYGLGGGTPEKVDEETIYREVGEESVFRTYPLAGASGSCPNDGFRVGAGALLPDCRAYELVSPLDKNNGDIKGFHDDRGYPTTLTQSAADGERMTYSSYRSFAGPESASPLENQYLASRDPEMGWRSVAVDPPLGPAGIITESGSPRVENFYKAFSPDLCDSWLVVAGEPGLAAGATEGFGDLYRRDDCGSAGYEALIQAPPTGETTPLYFNPELQGTSTDGKQAILRVQDKLATAGPPEAIGGGTWQTYYASGGQLRLVCVLPSGAASGHNCSGGTGGEEAPSLPANLYHTNEVSHALSANGRLAYWTDSGSGEAGPGKVYLRENPGEPQSAVSGGVCTEPEMACTVKVSGTKTIEPSRFLGASVNGERALFEVTGGSLEGKLYEFKLGAGSTEIAGEVVAVAGASDDLSRVYFVSKEALGGPNGQGRSPVLGQPNLYLDEEGAKSFIATLASIGGDLAANGALGDPPVFFTARVTGDGRVLAFSSTGPVTGYDNTDLVSGKADAEIYRYEAGSAGPVCVSCNPGGARPLGGVLEIGAEELPSAGALKMPFSDLYTTRALSSDGKRMFFDSFDGLLPRDTNGREDVYEWEAGSSQAECEVQGAELYVASADGCLSLISSGESPQDSEFLDASENGNDVFFTTSASLLPQDPGLIDIYDARVNGGFPQPTRTAGCEGEACQGSPVTPNDSTPASATFNGPGDLLSPPKSNVAPKRRCAKGKVLHKNRCVVKKHVKRARGRRRAKKSRRAAR